MKGFYLAGSVIFTALVLILSFQNISAQCSNMFLFFYPIRQNPTIVTLGMAALGIITGVFYHAFIGKVLAESDDEESDEF